MNAQNLNNYKDHAEKASEVRGSSFPPQDVLVVKWAEI